MNAWRAKTPLEWRRYVNQQVKVTANEKREYRGWVCTVDPVSASIVLVNFRDDSRPCVTVVMGHAVEEVEMLKEGDDQMVRRLASLFSPDADDAVTGEELQARKHCLRTWLEKNRIPVTEDGDNLCVAGVLMITPPYGSADCSSANEIILSRVQSLVESNPGPQN